ncbi:universal stress protein [Desulfosarcina ovata]|uniref:UspA domain-containing protein n=1 Tax=Desulfosarcina ovata subsp. ovata TaxID=2752305 RepID=A0A5K8AHV4_9BACT|nr:universal stress protein [Desulfosarcina ovata]BBO92272.1 hypothetical protein DSCOOX_54520 [Desulfosarcina ovata subsp. ovata]
MQETAPPNKILIAVDGSEQSLNAINYAANLFPTDRTHFVLFNVQTQLFDLFSDLGAYPHFKRSMTGLKRWTTEQKSEICETLDNIVAHFRSKGFPEEAISTMTPTKMLGVAQDIVKESYNGYEAIIVGRTGTSRFKDWVLKSTAMKLVAKVKHIPIIVVGGHPDAKNMLVAFNGSHEAMKGVAYAGSLVGRSDHRLQLYSMINAEKKFWEGSSPVYIPADFNGPIDTGSFELGQQLGEARQRLVDAGLAPEQISAKISVVDRERGYRIVEEARGNDYGSVVISRRELITFIDEYFIGRVSDKVLKLADELALWII